MCFSLGWLEQILVWVVIICAIIAILQIIIPWVLGKITSEGVLREAINVLVSVLRIVFWAFVAIVVIYLVFSLIACLISMGGGFPSLLPHR